MRDYELEASSVSVKDDAHTGKLLMSSLTLSPRVPQTSLNRLPSPERSKTSPRPYEMSPVAACRRPRSTTATESESEDASGSGSGGDDGSSGGDSGGNTSGKNGGSVRSTFLYRADNLLGTSSGDNYRPRKSLFASQKKRSRYHTIHRDSRSIGNSLSESCSILLALFECE